MSNHFSSTHYKNSLFSLSLFKRLTNISQLSCPTQYLWPKIASMMPRSPSNDENRLKKGPWTAEEDRKLVDYIEKHGHGSWRALPQLAGLNRCGKSCRLRWTNYLRPDIKRGKFSDQEEQIIINLHSALGNKWSMIASHLPGRTDNEIKNFWNTHLKKKLLQMGIDPVTHMPRTDLNIFSDLQQLLSVAYFSNLTRNSWENSMMLQSEATIQLAKSQLVQNILQLLNSNNTSASNRELEALYSNLPNIGSSFQNLSNFPISESSQQPLSCDDYQMAMDGSKSCRGFENDNDPVGTLLNMNPSSYSLPNLVPVSPEFSNKINEIMENKSGENSSSNLFKSAALEDNWGDLIADDATGSYWKDVVNQTSPQPWKIS